MVDCFADPLVSVVYAASLVKGLYMYLNKMTDILQMVFLNTFL